MGESRQGGAMPAAAGVTVQRGPGTHAQFSARNPHGLFNPQEVALEDVFSKLEKGEQPSMWSCMGTSKTKAHAKLKKMEDDTKNQTKEEKKVKLRKMAAQLHFAQCALLALPRGQRSKSYEQKLANKLEHDIAVIKKAYISSNTICCVPKRDVTDYVEPVILSDEKIHENLDMAKLKNFLHSCSAKRRG